LNERHVNAYSGAHGITIYHIATAAERDSNYMRLLQKGIFTATLAPHYVP
jgi:hypothetical protein